jgi:hypothetical protein
MSILPRTTIVDNYKSDRRIKAAMKILLGIFISLTVFTMVVLTAENKKNRDGITLLEDKITQLEITLERMPTKRKFIFPGQK